MKKHRKWPQILKLCAVAWLLVGSVTQGVAADWGTRSNSSKKWKNSDIQLTDKETGKVAKVKYGAAMQFVESTLIREVAHGVEFVVSPSAAANRERLHLYDMSELAQVWPSLRVAVQKKYLGDQDINNFRSGLFLPTGGNRLFGTPVKWNRAFATAMEGAYSAKCEGSNDKPENLLALNLMTQGLYAGAVKPAVSWKGNWSMQLPVNDTKGVKTAIEHSLCSQHLVVIHGTNSDSYPIMIGFNKELKKMLSESGIEASIAQKVPEPKTTVITYRELDGADISSVGKWTKE